MEFYNEVSYISPIMSPLSSPRERSASFSSISSFNSYSQDLYKQRSPRSPTSIKTLFTDIYKGPYDRAVRLRDQVVEWCDQFLREYKDRVEIDSLER